MQFVELIAPFERGCATAAEFEASKVFFCFTAVIPAQQAQVTMQKINKSDSPLSLPTELVHVKRIARATAAPAADSSSSSSQQRPAQVEIILCVCPESSSSSSSSSVTKELQEQVSRELGFAPSSFHVRRVPRAPIASHEWEFANAVWPLSVPRMRTRASDPSLFSKGITDAVSAALAAFSSTPSSPSMRAAVVDTKTGKVLAMFASDLPPSSACHLRCPYSFVPPTAADAADEDAATLAKAWQHPVFEVLRLVSRQQAQQEGYLCNDLALVSTHEPCVMCSMALVHSRCAMAFFLHKNSVHGGLGGVHFVNRTPTLNHRFPAYQVVVQASN